MQQSYMGQTLPPVRSGRPALPTWAFRMLWLTCWTLVISVGIGLSWDRNWHSKHAFDTFYSPPHLFIYTMVFFTALLVAGITFTPRLRVSFGSGFRFPLFPFELPGALFVTGAGLVTLGLAGLLDDLWHSSFGLDETGWSTPHAMIGWALLITVLGFVACRLALQRYRSIGWLTALLLSLLVLSFSAEPFMGPFDKNYTPAMVHAVSTIPILALQPAARHTFRIYQAWNLTRTNPLFVLFAAFWAGTVLSLLRGLNRHSWVFLLSTLIWTLLASNRPVAQFLLHTHSPALASWFPLPLFVAAATLIISLKLGMQERRAWILTGALFGLLIFLIWGGGSGGSPLTLLWSLLCILLAAPLMAAGALVGQRMYQVLEFPTRSRAWTLTLILGLQLPALTGILDLCLRRLTP